MEQDYAVNQAYWTGSEKHKYIGGTVEKVEGGPHKDLIDPLLRMGVCMSLCYHMAILLTKGTPVGKPGDDGTFFSQSGAQWQRKMSFQRAYDGHWFDYGCQLSTYDAFFGYFEKQTTGFLTKTARHDGLKIEKTLATRTKGDVETLLNGISAGTIYLVVIAGDGNKAKGAPPTQIWGHVVLVAKGSAASAKPIFFDPNLGQFSWSGGTSSVGTDTVAKLIEIYEGIVSLKIRDFILYKASKLA